MIAIPPKEKTVRSHCVLICLLAFISFGDLAHSQPAFAQSPATPARLVDVPLHGFMDFNYMSKKDLYALREAAVALYPELAEQPYQPSNAVFGRIEDGKPWWGVQGEFFYGSGRQSIVGPAYQSIYFANPFMLVGLEAGEGVVARKGNLTDIPYPKPLRLFWSSDSNTAGVKYDVSSFLNSQTEAGQHLRRIFTLIAYNARDFGMNYLYIDRIRSRHIEVTNSAPVPLVQFIHTGGSCGYPGGCNNMSPFSADMLIRVEDLPATAYIKLWRNKPADPSAPADMVYIMNMI